VYCGQTVGWIKMPLGTDVGLGLGPGDIVLHGDSAPPRKGAQQLPHLSPPHFTTHVYCGQTVAHLSNCWALVFVITSPLLSQFHFLRCVYTSMS